MVYRIEEKINGGMYDSVIFSEYFGGMKIVAADIETTGFSYKKSSVILTGFVYQDMPRQNAKHTRRAGDSEYAGSAASARRTEAIESVPDAGRAGDAGSGESAGRAGAVESAQDAGRAGDGERTENAGRAGDNESRRCILQFFADSPDDEKELLENTIDFLSDFDVIITFNGRAFDIPFLKKRAEFYGIDTLPLDRMYSFDMMRVLKYHSHLPEILPNMKQKTVEMYLGDSDLRKDTIDGEASVKLYFSYVDTPASMSKKRENIRDFILLHNRDDIVRLSEMMRILRMLDLHEIMNSEGFAIKLDENQTAVIRKIKIKSASLSIEGDIFGGSLDAAHYLTDYYDLVKVKDSSEFTANVSCERIEKALVADLCALDVDEDPLRLTGEYESGYLILSNDDVTNYREINMLVSALVRKLL